MVFFNHVLDSDSDEEIGWSKSKDLPQSRDSRTIKQLSLSVSEGTPGTSSTVLFTGPAAKRIKLERTVEIVEQEDEATRRLNIANWPEKLLQRLMEIVPIEDRIKLRSMCRSLRDVVDEDERRLIHEIDIRRLDETELGLFVAQDEKEGTFVIANKNFKWVERPLLRTFKEMRRGIVDWTRHHRNRMGRIKTAIRAMHKLAYIFKITISQVNLSNSLLRDITRVLDGQRIHSLSLEAQMYEHDRPDLTLLNSVPCQSISIAVRLREREPLPQIERFLAEAKHRFSQIVVEVRQDSWKFHSTLHFRKSYEDYGINNKALNLLMAGRALNFLRFKFLCRFVTKEGIIHIIKYLRGYDAALPSRGFCVVVQREAAETLIAELDKMPIFGTTKIPIPPKESKWPKAHEQFPCYNTDEEYLEVRPIRQEKEKKPLLSEVRYWRKGNDESVPHFAKRVDDSGRWDPFEQPRWKRRPI